MVVTLEEETKEPNSESGASGSALLQHGHSVPNGVNAMRKKSGLRDCLVPQLERTIETALQEAERKCRQFPQSQLMAEHVYTRFVVLFERLVQLEKAPTDDEVIKFCALLNRFERYYVSNYVGIEKTTESLIERRQRSRQMQELNHVFHSNIDTLLDILRVPEADPIRHWRSIFDDHRKECLNGLQVKSIGKKADNEVVKLTEFESMQSTFDWAGGATHEIGDPKLLVDYSWFLPLCDIVFDNADSFGGGAFGMVCRGTWKNNQVVVKYMGYEGDCGTKQTKVVSTKLFLHEVRIWCQLRHPNIVAFYGACHLGKRYMVSEDASGGQLRDFLRANEMRHLLVWQKLYEVALGVQYVHGKNIVHNDLKGDNILVRADGKAKLIDFGLSSIFNTAEVTVVDPKKMGGVHWRSPEYLAGKRPTFASDIYSLAMCILEVITDDIPWGSNMVEASVRFHVGKHRIPNPPAEMNEEQINLIERMTTFDPSQRLTISDVVNELYAFVPAELCEFDAQTQSESQVTGSPDADISGTKAIQRGLSSENISCNVIDQPTLDERTKSTVCTSWLIPLDQLIAPGVEYLTESSFGAIYTAVWQGTPVVIKFVGDEKRADNATYELFLHEIRIWHQLRHPHIISFFGACVTGLCYIVGEYVPNGNLRDFVKPSENGVLMWQKLYEAALGLEYLHGRNIVHSDLRCDNILVAVDKKAKLMGFALSSIIGKEEVIIEPSTIVDVQWKAPEYLRSGRPSFAADIFSLAMCILEALSGDKPWGSSIPDSTVRDQISQGRIPARPGAITGDQWELIELMTAADPSQRVKISYVSYALGHFAQDANLPDVDQSGVDDDKDANEPISSASDSTPDVFVPVYDQEPRQRIKLMVTSQWDNLYREQYVTIMNVSSSKPDAFDNSLDEVLEREVITLFDAVSLGRLDVVQLMIKNNGNSVSVKDGKGRTPLFEAASRGHADIVRALLENGVSVDEYDEDHRTALFGATAAAVEILIANGASVNIVDRFGWSPLHAAIERGDLEMAQVLIQNGVDVNHASPETEAPVAFAGRLGHMSIFAALIQAGASVNVRDRNGDTPLMPAARWGYSDGFRLLMLLEGHSLHEKNALVVDSLARMTEISASSSTEFAELLTRLIKRLNHIYTPVHLTCDIQVHQGAITAFISIMFRICRLLVQCQMYESPLARFVRNRVVSLKVRDFHEELDHLVSAFDASQTEPDWSAQWEEDVRAQVDRFLEILRFDDSSATGIQDNAKTIESAILLQHELMNCDGNVHPDFLRSTAAVTNRLLQTCTCEMPGIPEWFIPRDDVEFGQWNAMEGGASPTKFHGKWISTSVTIATSTLASHEFEQRASQWYQLKHPHVVALYGACHVGPTRFTVYEYTPNGTILDFLGLKDNRHLMWCKLYEAFLGLHYLHARNYIHGDLDCQHIVIGSDYTAKLGGFEQDEMRAQRLNRMRPPEVLRGDKLSLASDIYAFGMCILEATTLKRPWFPFGHFVFREKVRLGKLPDRPESFSDDQWDLLTKMCALKPADRVSIAYVVHQLKKFHENSNDAHDAHIEPSDYASIDTYRFQQLNFDTIPVKLHKIRDRCQQLPESKWLIRDVCPALDFLLDRMVSQQMRPSDIATEKYCAVLCSLGRYLRIALSEESIVLAARSRQVAESHHVIYEELDRLLDMVHVSKTDPIRSWKRSQVSIDQQILKREKCVKASAISEAVSLKHFKLSSTEGFHRINTDEPNAVPNAVPTWYLPLRELHFSSTDEIGVGAFGKVYKGVWLDTPVVVKFMGYEEDQGTSSNELFLHEVRVWRRLKKHPHIVELYGACHVDKRYFVCEYASNGELRDYLKRAGNDHLVWEKLYEVALGLAYMHGLNVVHNDLKGGNFMVGADGKAKVIDFGLSAIVGEAEITIDAKHMGAVHWKSPEYLAGGRPSFASDVYSFAMCILEAVTGDIPWGSNMISALVKFRVKKGTTPTRPKMMNDKQWNLIELMTKQNPSERVKMPFVVDKLFEIYQEEMTLHSSP